MSDLADIGSLTDLVTAGTLACKLILAVAIAGRVHALVRPALDDTDPEHATGEGLA